MEDCDLPDFLYLYFNPVELTSGVRPVGFSKELTCLSFEEFRSKYPLWGSNIELYQVSILDKNTNGVVSNYDKEDNPLKNAPHTIEEVSANEWNHKYSREDSISMNKFITPLEEHYNKFNNKNGELLPAFIKWDSVKNNYQKINPIKNLVDPKQSEDFGDNWSDELDAEDKVIINNYLTKFDHLKKKFGFINFKVGNKDFIIKLSNKIID